ncbi:hypothetical protein GCM10023075_77360 [Streptosporangium album]
MVRHYVVRVKGFRTARAVVSEGELSDQQGHGEAHARQNRQAEHVDPGEAVVELGPGEAGHQPGGGHDSGGFPDDQAGEDPNGDGVAQRGGEAQAAEGHAGGQEREEGHGQGRTEVLR